MAMARTNRQPKTETELGCRERALLAEAIEQGGRCGLVHIARAIATGESSREPASGRTRRLYTALYHNQLRTLRESGLVTYCEESGQVQVTARGYALWSDG